MKKKPTKRKNWTQEDIEMLTALFPDNYTLLVCEKLGRSYASVAGQATLLKLKKSPAFREKELARQADRLRVVGKKSRYPKESSPWNKGQKMDAETYEKIKKTMFVKGQKPWNAKEDGEEVLRDCKGARKYWMRKVTGKSKLVFKHVWLWEQSNGPVPAGFNVVFRDGNTENCTLRNLECISNAELMRRNTIQRYPQEIISTIKLIHKVKKVIDGKE